MMRTSILQYTWPVVGLSVLLTAACLASIAYIGRLQSDLGESLRADSERLQTAQQAQIHLREYRVHSIVLAAGPNEVRRRQVEEDQRRFRVSLDSLWRLAEGPEDRRDLEEVEAGWTRYQGELEKDAATRPAFQTVAELAAWTDLHRSSPLHVPCSRLVERSEKRMAQNMLRGREQSQWAGWGLLTVGLVGPLAGLVGGYAIARGLSRRVAQLSVRVQAARAHLEQDVGVMTLETPQSLADLDSQLEHVVERVRDVCQRLQEQERDLLRAEQLAAVGQLAAGVAHEIRNPLTGIKMLVESAVRPVNPTSLTAADLELIRDEIGRLERTVQGLLDYAKPAPTSRMPHDVRQASFRAAEIVAVRAKRAKVDIVVDMGDEPLMARIDSDQFASLLSNLLINAIDATPPNNQVRLEGGLTSDQRHVRLTVSDSGTGIPAELAGMLFTPFATTKASGTGLGLAVARRVAIDHGGTLTAANKPGGGACFTVTVPIVEVADAEAPHR